MLIQQTDGEEFSVPEYLHSVAHAHWPEAPDAVERLERCLSNPWAAKEICRGNPLLFGIRYFLRHLHSEATGNKVTMGNHHIAWHNLIVALSDPVARTEAIVAPRGASKSTWFFLIAPSYWLAYGYAKFVMALADSSTQGQEHLASAKREYATNLRLRASFPDLCTPATRRKGIVEGDRQSLYKSNGGVFSAFGIDSSVLGLKVGAVRPDI